MNDIGYVNITFKGSMNETSIKTASEKQLQNLLPYYSGAVKYHTKEQNPKQVVFFQAGEKLIKKRLKI